MPKKFSASLKRREREEKDIKQSRKLFTFTTESHLPVGRQGGRGENDSFDLSGLGGANQEAFSSDEVISALVLMSNSE